MIIHMIIFIYESINIHYCCSFINIFLLLYLYIYTIIFLIMDPFSCWSQYPRFPQIPFHAKAVLHGLSLCFSASAEHCMAPAR